MAAEAAKEVKVAVEATAEVEGVKVGSVVEVIVSVLITVAQAVMVEMEVQAVEVLDITGTLLLVNG